MCSTDVTIQYAYYYVIILPPQVTELCRDNFAIFMDGSTSLLDVRARTQAEADYSITQILLILPGSQLASIDRAFLCENGTYIIYWGITGTTSP
jgi:hypothetical protein